MSRTDSIGTLARKHLASLGAGGAGSRGIPGGHKPQNWPTQSFAMVVHPTEIKDTQARLAKAGLKCEFNKMGIPTLESQAHYERVASTLGFCDTNASSGRLAPTKDHEDRYKQRMADRMNGLRRMHQEMVSNPNYNQNRG